MHHIRKAFFIAFGLCLAPATSHAQSGSSGSFPCLNDTLAACKSLVAAHYSIVGGNLDEVMTSWKKVDVSGNRVTGQMKAYAMVASKDQKGNISYHTYDFNLNSFGLVDNIGIDLKLNPASASTKEEYDKTKIFDLIRVFIPEFGCEYYDRMNFYRFFNDYVKPNIKGPIRDGYVGVGSATDEYQYRSQRISMCDAYIEYRRDYGISTVYMDSDNPSGRFNNISIGLWTSPSRF